MLPTVPVFDRSKTLHLFTVVFYVVLTLAGLWLLYVLRSLIPPFLIAITIALTLAPEIDRMERRGWNRSWSILIIYALFIAVFVSFMIVLVPFVSTQLGQVAQHLIPASLLATPSSAHVTNMIADFMKNHHWPSMVRAPLINQAQHVPEFLSTYLSNLSQQLPIWASNLIWVIVVPILAFYFLADYHKIMGKTLLFVQPSKRVEVLRLLNDVVAVFGNYVRGLLLMMGLDIVVSYAVLRIAGVPFPETIAVLAGVLYAIPYLGAIISTVLIGLVAWSKSASLAITVLVIMVIIHQVIFDQIVAPRIIGKQVGLHPLWAITAMLIGGEAFGVGGTLLAVPLAAGVQVVLVHLFPSLKDDTVSLLSEKYMEESDKKAQVENQKAGPADRSGGVYSALSKASSRSASHPAARR